MQKLLPPLLYLIALIAILSAHFFSATAASSPLLLILGIVIAIAGLAISAFHARLFRREETNIHTFNNPDKLVQKGLFRYTRNPMYLGFSISLLGWALAFGSVLGWLAAAAFVLASDRWYIPFEERAMRETFGEDYARYCAQTGRWFTLPNKHTD